MSLLDIFAWIVLLILLASAVAIFFMSATCRDTSPSNATIPGRKR
jgi:hypothetical protein